MEILLSYKSILKTIQNDSTFNRYTIHNGKDYKNYIDFIEILIHEKKYCSYKYKMKFFTPRMNNIFNKNRKILETINKLYYDLFIENGYIIYDTDTKKTILFWDAIHQTLFLENKYAINLTYDANYAGISRYKFILKNTDMAEFKEILKKINENISCARSISLNEISLIPFNIYDEELQQYFKDLKIYQVYFPVQYPFEIIDSINDINLVANYKHDNNYIYLKSEVPIKFEKIYRMFDAIATHEINDIQMILAEDKIFTTNKELSQLTNVYYVMSEECSTILYKST